MLDPDEPELFLLSRLVTSVTLAMTIAHTAVVLLGSLTNPRTRTALNVLTSVILGLAFMHMHQAWMISCRLRSAARAVSFPELGWLAPDPLAWTTAVVVLFLTSAVPFQAQTPRIIVLWSTGAAALFILWLRMLTNLCRALQATVTPELPMEKRAKLKDWRGPRRIGKRHLIAFLTSQIAVLFLATLVPMPAFVGHLSAAILGVRG